MDDTGSADLTTQPLEASRPQFLVALEGLAGPIGEVTIELTWTGENLTECGAVEPDPPGDTTTTTTTAPPGATPVSSQSGVVVVPRFAS